MIEMRRAREEGRHDEPSLTFFTQNAFFLFNFKDNLEMERKARSDLTEDNNVVSSEGTDEAT